MTLIDTSAWIEFFRRQGNPEGKKRVAELINRDEAVFSCPIQFELLAGARPGEVGDIDLALSFATHIKFSHQHWLEAARLEKELRRKGITIPRDDILVAALAKTERLPILAYDNHFQLLRDQGKILLKLV